MRNSVSNYLYVTKIIFLCNITKVCELLGKVKEKTLSEFQSIAMAHAEHTELLRKINIR